MKNAGHRRVGRLITVVVGLIAGGQAALSQSSSPAFDFEPALSRANDLPRLRSILVSWNGDTVLEQYFNGASADRLTNVKSVSKSVMSGLVGVAISEGLIESVDQPIGDLLPGIPDDPVRSQIRIGDLLSMQAGLETTSNRNYGRWVQSEDWVRFALEQPVVAEPGGPMIYSTGNTHLLSAIITSVSGESTLDFARRAFAPLGFELAAWPTDPGGLYFGGNDMEFTPRQMLALGVMYLNKGRYGADQVLPEAWVNASWEPRVESPREEGRYYGYGWWIRDMAGFESPYAWGYGGQFIVTVPELNLVIVTTSSSYPGDGRRQHTRQIYELVENGLVAPAAVALGFPNQRS